MTNTSAVVFIRSSFVIFNPSELPAPLFSWELRIIMAERQFSNCLICLVPGKAGSFPKAIKQLR